jgi:TRAP transporter TAXI family solute receptor
VETIDRIWNGLTDLTTRLWIALMAIVLLLFAVGTWTNFTDPPAIILATGREDLAYWKNGIVFARALEHGLTVKVVSSAGSLDNLKMLLNKSADAALIQGDVITGAHDAPNLQSLGAVFYEVLWNFRRHETEDGGSAPAPQKGLGDLLRGKTIAIGPDGSGAQKLARTVLALNGITGENSKLLSLETDEAVRQVQAGTIQAALFAASWDAGDVRQLCIDPNVDLLGDPEAASYKYKQQPRLHAIEVPRGFCAGGKPPVPLTVVATKASLIIRDDLPLTIQYRMLKEIRQIQPPRQLTTEPFPSRETPDGVALSPAAEEYYNNTFYQLNSFVAHLHLPLRITELILLALHSPVAKFIIGVLSLPLLLRLLSGFTNWRQQRPVNRLRDRVSPLEVEIEELRGPVDKSRFNEMSGDIDELEQQGNYLMRRHGGGPHNETRVSLLLGRIKEMRRKLQQHRPEGAAGHQSPLP